MESFIKPLHETFGSARVITKTVNNFYFVTGVADVFNKNKIPKVKDKQ